MVRALVCLTDVTTHDLFSPSTPAQCNDCSRKPRPRWRPRQVCRPRRTGDHRPSGLSLCPAGGPSCSVSSAASLSGPCSAPEPSWRCWPCSGRSAPTATRVCDQVAACAELRRRQWEDRSLRSRQRRNYLRLVHRCAARRSRLEEPCWAALTSGYTSTPDFREILIFRRSYICVT